MPEILPVKFEAPVLEELPAELNTAAINAVKAQPKQKKAMAQARAFARFGVQVLRVKSRVLSALGKEGEQCGIRQIGHGKILLASDYAEETISKLGGIVDDLLTKTPGPDYRLILDIMRLQVECNSQLIKTAEAHFAADRQPQTGGPAGNSITVPYPSGSPVMIGIGKPPPPV